jgi:hypothetical protein
MPRCDISVSDIVNAAFENEAQSRSSRGHQVSILIVSALLSGLVLQKIGVEVGLVLPSVNGGSERGKLV